MKKILLAALAAIAVFSVFNDEALAQGSIQYVSVPVVWRHQKTNADGIAASFDSTTISHASNRVDTSAAFFLGDCIRSNPGTGATTDSSFLFRFSLSPSANTSLSVGTSMDSLNIAWQFSNNGRDWSTASAPILNICTGNNCGRTFNVHNQAQSVGFAVGAPGIFFGAKYVRFIVTEDFTGEARATVDFFTNNQKYK